MLQNKYNLFFTRFLTEVTNEAGYFVPIYKALNMHNVQEPIFSPLFSLEQPKTFCVYEDPRKHN